MTDLLADRMKLLTPREREACELFSAGYNTTDAARLMKIARGSAKTLRKRVRRKLGTTAQF